jgi:alkylation response protein AidB-like acyl-CoA dehydrogenase
MKRIIAEDNLWRSNEVHATEAADLVATARGLGPLIHDSRDESERERRLPASVLSAMQMARLFRMYVPVEYGGLETDPITSMQAIEGHSGGRFGVGGSDPRVNWVMWTA